MKSDLHINSIDIARLAAAILVVASHTQAITWFPNQPNGDIQILTRLAVPFFFCTSGYFLQKSYAIRGYSAIVSSLLKTIYLYVGLSLVYFTVIFLQNQALLRESKKWMLIDFMINGSYYHLWYLVGAIYSILTILLFCKLKITKFLFPLSIFCYVVGLLGTSYYSIGCNLPGLALLFDSKWFLAIRRIFLMGFPFTVLGWVSPPSIQKSLRGGRLWRVTVLTGVLFVSEVIVVTVFGVSKTIVISIFLYPLLFLLFELCLAYPCKKLINLAAFCKGTANVTYYWHPIVILLVSRIIVDRFMLFLVTTAICLLGGLGYHVLKSLRSSLHEHHANF